VNRCHDKTVVRFKIAHLLSEQPDLNIVQQSLPNMCGEEEARFLIPNESLFFMAKMKAFSYLFLQKCPSEYGVSVNERYEGQERRARAERQVVNNLP
jgi:hypothetical protein